jgi:hypothetical protein
MKRKFSYAIIFLVSLKIKYALWIISSVVLYLGLFMAVSCSSSELELKSNAQTINTPQVKEDSSEQVAKKLTEQYDKKNCKEFINAFPNTFQDFNQLYGYDDQEGERILFSKLNEHISYFFNCSEVSDREKLNKVVSIGINGKWDADAIGMFQDSTFDLIKDHPNEAKEILDSLPDDKAASFWFFLFDGPHPNDKENVKRVGLLSNLLGKKSKQTKLLLEQFQKLRDSDEH